MKKTYAALLLLCVSFGALYAQSRPGPSVRVVNNTGYVVYYLYVSQSSNDDWEDDVLEDAVLTDGESIIVRLPAPIEDLYDFRLEDEDGDTYTKWKVAVKPNMIIEFTFDDFDEDG